MPHVFLIVYYKDRKDMHKNRNIGKYQQYSIRLFTILKRLNMSDKNIFYMSPISCYINQKMVQDNCTLSIIF